MFLTPAKLSHGAFKDAQMACMNFGNISQNKIKTIWVWLECAENANRTLERSDEMEAVFSLCKVIRSIGRQAIFYAFYCDLCVFVEGLFRFHFCHQKSYSDFPSLAG